MPINAEEDKKVGTWMYTWWQEKTDIDWIEGGNGLGSINQLLGDVDGDGKDDAVVNDNSGNWYVALSDGFDFASYTQWTSAHGSGSSKDFLADVDGDGKKDAVSFFGSTGSWTVALSNGSNFGTSTQWCNQHGNGSANQLMADVNGDGIDDAVAFFGNGDWWVLLSNGSSFGNAFKLTSMGSGSTKQMFGDFNGDGIADPVVLWTSVGDWWVGISNGTTVTSITKWAGGFGVNSTNQLVGDVDDDGKTDAIAFYSDGTWYKAISSGTAFGTSTQMGGFTEDFGEGSTKQFFGNTYGNDARTLSQGWDKPQTLSLVTFTSSGGKWQAQGLNQYAWMNRWEGWNVKYRQEISEGVFGTYDQETDNDVIDYQLSKLTEAGVDFLILDETNNIHVDDDALLDAALNIADRIRIWNSDPSNKSIKYAIAVGEVNFTNNVQSIESDCDKVYDLFVNTAHGGSDNYYYVDGKPLVVVYTWLSQRQDWENWTGDKTESNQFSVRWAEGPIPHTSEYADYYGWYNTADGPYTSGTETVFVTPRKPNDQTIFAKDLQFYKDSWETAIQLGTDSIVVGGMDDYTEANAIWPTDTSLCDASIQEQWENEGGQFDPYVYWNWTKHYINQYKGNRTNSYTNDFESSMTGWSNAWHSFYSWYAYQGTGSLAIPNGNKTEYTVTNLQANTTYHVEGFIRKEYNSGGNPTVGVNTHGFSEEVFDTYNNAQGYTMFTYTFTTGSSNTSATIFVDNSATGGGHAFLDNIKVFK